MVSTTSQINKVVEFIAVLGDLIIPLIPQHYSLTLFISA